MLPCVTLTFPSVDLTNKSVAENFSTLGKLFSTRRKPGTPASIWSKELEPAANLDGCRHCQLIHHLLLEAFDAESLIGLTSGVTTIVVDVFLGSSSINLPHFFTICVHAIKSITLWIQAANKGKNRLKIVRVEWRWKVADLIRHALMCAMTCLTSASSLFILHNLTNACPALSSRISQAHLVLPGSILCYRNVLHYPVF